MLRLFAPHIYLAGPMGKPEVIAENCARALDAAEQLYQMGVLVKVPHLMVAWQTKHPHTYEEWMAIDFATIIRCDALYRMPGDSPGADREVAFAEERGITVLRTLIEARLFVAGFSHNRGGLAEMGA